MTLQLLTWIMFLLDGTVQISGLYCRRFGIPRFLHLQISTLIQVYMLPSPVRWPGVKNSPNVAHVCRKRRLK
jgi:hypothetical protein